MNFNPSAPLGNRPSTRILWIFIMLFAFAGTSNAAQSWNILVGNFSELSVKDSTVNVMLKKSIKVQLGKQPDFNALYETNDAAFFTGFSDARSNSLVYRADVAVYGSYYIEGQSLVISVYVYDVLNGRLKMRRVYRGAVTIDIFDTIDALAGDIVKMVREALPVLSYEEEVKVITLRRTIYQSEESKVQRMLYTRMGALTTGTVYPYTEFALGLSFRIWDIRLDAMVGALAGVKGYDWYLNSLSYYSYLSPRAFLSWYLPVWDKRLAVGAGICAFNMTELYITNASNPDNENNRPAENAAFWSLYVIYHPLDSLEMSLAVCPVLSDTKYANNPANQNNSNLLEVDHMDFQYTVPVTQIGAIWFPAPAIGVELDLLFGYGTLTVNYVNNRPPVTSSFLPFSAYIGMVYKIDLLKEDQVK